MINHPTKIPASSSPPFTSTSHFNRTSNKLPQQKSTWHLKIYYKYINPSKKTEILVGHLRGCCFLSLPTNVLRPPSEAPLEWSDQRQVWFYPLIPWRKQSKSRTCGYFSTGWRKNSTTNYPRRPFLGLKNDVETTTYSGMLGIVMEISQLPHTPATERP